MENPLDKLINNIQQEYDYLDKALNDCLVEWDFKGADAFKKPYLHSKEKLEILKGLKDPNYSLIKDLKHQIDKIESLKEPIQSYFLKMEKERLQEYKDRLEDLEGQSLPKYIDSDVILNTLYDLGTGSIQSFVIELVDHRIALHVQLQGRELELSVKSNQTSPTQNRKMDTFYIQRLKVIGFQEIDAMLRLNLGDYTEIRLLEYLEIMARVVFDALSITGKDIVLLSINT